MAGVRRRTVLAGLASLVAPMPGLRAQSQSNSRINYVIHLSLVPLWFNPSEHAGGQSAFAVYYAIHDSLVKPMPAGRFTPCLAESWSVSPDGLVYEFVIRRNVKFHNGDPLTSEDAKFSYERYKGSAASVLKSRVASVETPDPYRLRFVLKAPWPDFMQYYALQATAAAWVLPKKYIETVGDEGFKRAPIGAGPYRFKSFKPGLELELEAYDEFWGKKPQVKTIMLRTVSEETTRAAVLQNGEADAVIFFRGQMAAELKKVPGITLKVPGLHYTQWLTLPDQWNPDSPWSKLEVRQAADFAINRPGISQAEFIGLAPPAGSMVPPGIQFAKKFEPTRYDPAEAKRLLAQAGYPNGFDGGDIHTDVSYVLVCEAVQADLHAAGIRTRLRSLERAAFYAQQNSLKGVVFSILSGFDNAGTWLEQFVAPGGRSTYGTYPDLTALMQAQSVEIDEQKRAAILDKAQQIVHDRKMYIPVVYAVSIYAQGPRVEESGFALIPGYGYAAPYEDVRMKRG